MMNLDELAALLTDRSVIVGVGNDIKGDDAVGPMIAAALSSRFTTFDGATVPEAYIPAIREQAPDIVVFIDAARMGGAPGSVGIFTRSEVGGTLFSTHSMPLSTMARYLEQEVGCTVYIVGIEPKSFGFGEPISQEVGQSAQSIITIFGGKDVR